jgi:hypothetical protein
MVSVGQTENVQKTRQQDADDAGKKERNPRPDVREQSSVEHVGRIGKTHFGNELKVCERRRERGESKEEKVNQR